MDTQKEEITRETAARIRALRQQRGLSQEAVALRADLNPAYFGHIERGLKCPTVDTLNKIAGALDLPLWELLRFDGPPAAARDRDIDARCQALLTQVPEHKREQVLRILEDIVALL